MATPAGVSPSTGGPKRLRSAVTETVTGRVLYCLPVPVFFGQFGGLGGHVAHAYGVLGAFWQAGWQVHLLAGESNPRAAVYVTRTEVVNPVPAGPVGRQWWGRQVARRARIMSGSHRFDLAYIRYSTSFVPWLARWIDAVAPTPVVVELNSFASQARPWLSVLEARALRKASIVLCVSTGVRDAAIELLGNELTDKTVVIPNGVDPARFATDTHSTAAADRAEREALACRVGYVGVLKTGYGLESLVDAMALVRDRHPHASLHVYGDGPLRSWFEARTASSPGLCVEGPVPFDTVPSVLRRLDVLVSTTSAPLRYGSPTKIYEYMAAGRPIVAADTPQIRPLLGDGNRGMLYRVGDAADLARCIIQLLDDPATAAEYGRRARENVLEHHTWDQRIQSLLEHVRSKGGLS